MKSKHTKLQDETLMAKSQSDGSTVLRVHVQLYLPYSISTCILREFMFTLTVDNLGPSKFAALRAMHFPNCNHWQSPFQKTSKSQHLETLRLFQTGFMYFFRFVLSLHHLVTTWLSPQSSESSRAWSIKAFAMPLERQRGSTARLMT